MRRQRQPWHFLLLSMAAMAWAATAWPDLRLLSISENRFLLHFKSVVKLPDGSYRFSVTDRKNSRTHFLKVGDEWKGFRIAAFEPKVEEAATPGGAPGRDISVLVLERGSKTIRLVRGQAVPYVEYTAKVKVVSTGEEISAKESETFKVADVLFTVAEIDPKAVRARIATADLPDGKWIDAEKEGAEPSTGG